MTIERAVYRLTGEVGEWFRIDAGVLAEGRRADVVVVDPQALDQRVEEAHEAEMDGFGDLRRVVRRNPGTVRAVVVNGRLAAQDDTATPGLGQMSGFGQVLRAS